LLQRPARSEAVLPAQFAETWKQGIGTTMVSTITGFRPADQLRNFLQLLRERTFAFVRGRALQKRAIPLLLGTLKVL